MPRPVKHFKVSMSFPRHPNTIRVWLDNDMLACAMRVLEAMTRHYADHNDDQCVVGPTELRDIANTKQVGGAVQRLRRLSAMSSIEFLDPSCAQDATKVRAGCAQAVSKVSSRGSKVWVLGWPNFTKKQGYGPRNAKQRGPSALRTPHTANQSEEREALSPAGPASTDEKTEGEKPQESRGSPVSDDLEETLPQTRNAELLLAWAGCVRAAADYGKRWNPKPSGTRLAAMRARLREHPTADSDVFVRAIHGAAKLWAGDDEGDRIAKYLRPETIFQVSKFEKYVEAYNEPERSTDGRDNKRSRSSHATLLDDARRVAEDLGIVERGDEGTADIIDITPRTNGGGTE